MRVTRREAIGAAAGTLGLAVLPRVAWAAAGVGSPLVLAEAGSPAGALAVGFAAECGWDARSLDLSELLSGSEALARRPLVGVTNYAAFVLAQDLARARRARMVHAVRARSGALHGLAGAGRMRGLAGLEEQLRALSAAPGGAGTMLWATVPA